MQESTIHDISIVIEGYKYRRALKCTIVKLYCLGLSIVTVDKSIIGEGAILNVYIGFIGFNDSACDNIEPKYRVHNLNSTACEAEHKSTGMTVELIRVIIEADISET